MPITYSDALSSDLHKIRFRIGDTVEGQGPRPTKERSNFTNGEIEFVLEEESDRLNGATAHLFEILANEWAAYAISERAGDNAYDAKEVSDKYAALAKLWRSKPGGASDADSSGGLITITRTDAWTGRTTEYTPSD